MENQREKMITQTSVIGIIVNLFLSAFKAVIGLISGSIAIVLDAVNNLTDAMSSVITIIGIKLARRVPDDKHPYGYGRIEYFSTILIAVIILFAGSSSLIESVKKIFEPEMPDYSAAAIIIVSVSVIAKLVLGRFVKGRGEKFNSDALVASGSDASFDAIISASTLVAAIVTLIFKISIDGIVGAVISCFIIKAGIEMLMEAVNDVMGNRPDSEITQEIRKSIEEIDPVLGAYDLILHDYGPESAIGSVHVEVPASLTANEIHQLEVKIGEKIHHQYHIGMTVGIYSVDEQNPDFTQMRNQIRDYVKTFPGVINTHGYYIDHREKKVLFDVKIDFTIRDKQKFVKDVTEGVKKLYPDYTASINLDMNYSD